MKRDLGIKQFEWGWWSRFGEMEWVCSFLLAVLHHLGFIFIAVTTNACKSHLSIFFVWQTTYDPL